ncbi:hypothetical protein QMK33_17295 [Hymenobacter sp. H14-R3]|uniref:hypothetical protein n=1 Tax=Hymenobacter sp. H14-R3 TaxID=3046308 RepID=UPI0024BBBA01|nr:hypothetical protein [Hymenobacter sp. H14-R3]MDJ0366909.1 hypothetical protein [Hymenobacter sp. H14-R3]
MEAKVIAANLLLLGYTKQWLDCGILTVDDLSKQCEVFQTGEDPNLEHYRYGTFRRYLTANKSLSDRGLINYLRLILADDDSMMAGAAARDLFSLTTLTDGQFKYACEKIDTLDGEWKTRLLTRQKLLRLLKKDGLSPSLFIKCLDIGDKIVQEFIVGLADKQQLTELAANGITRKVRNLAAAQVKHTG